VTNYTVSATPSEGGSVSGGDTFTSGSSATLVANPASGYSFVNWTENGAAVSSSASYSFTVAANRNLVANFTTSQLPPPPPKGGILPADRMYPWTPGLMSKGGIPNRTTICATLSPGANIQAALDSCPAGQVVQLNAGTFTVNNYLLIHSGITLRGAGPDRPF
jgi:Divergent InlB B-repeat domain